MHAGPGPVYDFHTGSNPAQTVFGIVATSVRAAISGLLIMIEWPLKMQFQETDKQELKRD